MFLKWAISFIVIIDYAMSWAQIVECVDALTLLAQYSSFVPEHLDHCISRQCLLWVGTLHIWHFSLLVRSEPRRARTRARTLARTHTCTHTRTQCVHTRTNRPRTHDVCSRFVLTICAHAILLSTPFSLKETPHTTRTSVCHLCPNCV